jgi:sodium-dependent dicarboxylate transporter 2/3/5
VNRPYSIDISPPIAYNRNMSDEENGGGQTTAKWIGFFLGIALFLFFLIFPIGLTPAAAKVAAVSALMACWWITVCVPIPVTSIIPIVLFPAMEIMPSKDAVKFYADDNIYLFLGGFILALALEKWNLHRRIALTLVNMVGTSPRRLVLGFLGATALISMLISNTATTMMMFPIALAIVRETFELAQAKDDNFAVALMLAVAYGASIGGIATPIGTPPNIVMLGQFRESFPGAPAITFFEWSKIFVPLSIIFIPIAWLVLVKIVAPPRLQVSAGREIVRDELRKLGRMRGPEAKVFAIFIVTVLLWVFRQPMDLQFVKIPGWSQLFGQPAFLSDATVAIAMALVLFLIPAGGKTKAFLMDWPTAVRVPWGILLLFGGGFAIAGGFRQAGLDVALGQAIRPYLNVTPILAVAIVSLVVTFMTEVASNTATAAALIPIMIGTAGALGLNPLLLMVPTTISASFGFMLPVGTPPNAIVFSSGYVPMSKMIKAGLILDLVAVILTTLWVYFVVLPAWGYGTAMPGWAQ